MKLQPEKAVETWGGMECTINRVGDQYFDQLDHSGHRDRPGDITLFARLGIKKMRYPILWEHHQPQANLEIEWSATDTRMAELQEANIGIIAGLVHHGSGPAFVDIRENSFAEGLAIYAGEVATRYPWIDYYTPVNEPLTTARFCGLYGIWYPHEQNDNSFCRILINECRATVLAMAAIRRVNPAAKLVQTDDLAKIHSTRKLAYQADFENERRWLSYDLLCGIVNRKHALWGYLTGHGIGTEELEYFIQYPCPPDVMGFNYYLTSERYLDENLAGYPVHTHGGNGQHTYADVEAVRVGKIQPDGLKVLLKAAWERYHIPIAITEVHLHCTREEQMRWLNDAWLAAKQLNKEGVPIIAITAWAMLGAFGWDTLLTFPGGNYEAGIFDISSGKPRPTILAEMIRAYSNDQPYAHPALQVPGWWNRCCRSSYGSDETSIRVWPFGKTLAISGYLSAELKQVCRNRCLHLTEVPFSADKHWAVIIINEYLEMRTEGCPDLVIRLTPENLLAGINGGLDLLLDNESGDWEIGRNGLLIKQIQEFSIVPQFAG
jgi:dTDP-4-dehydrorhamnose reductase